MNRLLAFILLSGISAKAQTITETFGTGANQFSIDFVQIGNPGNAADTTGSPNPAGSVSYIYNIGKYEVSREMIETANIAGGLGLTLADMSSYGGNGPYRPATGISWNEAARFVNWLNTSKGYQAAYNFTTSDPNDNIGLWGVGQSSGSNLYRHKDAYYFLPTLDEWYKAAYGSPNGTWYRYPTGSDVAPVETTGGITQDTAVFNIGASPADIMNAGGLSAFETMAQGGNTWEWVETSFDGVNDSVTDNRELRGGAWGIEGSNLMLASSRITNFGPADDHLDFGLRVASVPEPSALSLLAVGLGGLAILRRRRS